MQRASCALSGSTWQAAKGTKSSVRPPEWKSSTMSAIGSSVRSKKSAIFSVTVPSGRPGKDRFRLPPSIGDSAPRGAERRIVHERHDDHAAAAPRRATVCARGRRARSDLHIRRRDCRRSAAPSARFRCGRRRSGSSGFPRPTSSRLQGRRRKPCCTPSFSKSTVGTIGLSLIAAGTADAPSLDASGVGVAHHALEAHRDVAAAEMADRFQVADLHRGQNILHLAAEGGESPPRGSGAASASG